MSADEVSLSTEGFIWHDGKGMQLSEGKVEIKPFTSDDACVESMRTWLSDEEIKLKLNLCEPGDGIFRKGWRLHDFEFEAGIHYDGVFIGFCEVHWDRVNHTAGIVMAIGDATYRKKGIGTTVSRLLCDFCFNVIGVEVVNADVVDCDLHSVSFLTQAGFRQTGVYRKHRRWNGEHYDVIHADILVEEYRRRNKGM